MRARVIRAKMRVNARREALISTFVAVKVTQTSDEIRNPFLKGTI